MTPIQLDLSKLLGFKIIANEVSLKPQHVSIGAKLGEKEGFKTSPAVRIGAKLGGKPGDKNA